MLEHGYRSMVEGLSTGVWIAFAAVETVSLPEQLLAVYNSLERNMAKLLLFPERKVNESSLVLIPLIITDVRQQSCHAQRPWAITLFYL